MLFYCLSCVVIAARRTPTPAVEPGPLAHTHPNPAEAAPYSRPGTAVQEGVRYRNPASPVQVRGTQITYEPAAGGGREEAKTSNRQTTSAAALRTTRRCPEWRYSKLNGAAPKETSATPNRRRRRRREQLTTHIHEVARA